MASVSAVLFFVLALQTGLTRSVTSRGVVPNFISVDRQGFVGSKFYLGVTARSIFLSGHSEIFEVLPICTHRRIYKQTNTLKVKPIIPI